MVNDIDMVTDVDMLFVKIKSMMRTIESVDWSPLGESAEIAIVKAQRLLASVVGVQT